MENIKRSQNSFTASEYNLKMKSIALLKRDVLAQAANPNL